MESPDIEEFRARLKGMLRAAMKAKDAESIAALRSAVSAIDNAEAVSPPRESHLVPRLGIGAAEMPRRRLSLADIRDIVRREKEERESAASQYLEMGRHEPARSLHAQAAILGRLLT